MQVKRDSDGATGVAVQVKRNSDGATALCVVDCAAPTFAIGGTPGDWGEDEDEWAEMIFKRHK